MFKRRAHQGVTSHRPAKVAGINPDGPLCYCGQRGCVETYISGSGVEARYAERHGEKRSFAEIADGYERREPGAVEAMQAFFRNFGRSLANVIDVLDPDVISWVMAFRNLARSIQRA